MTILQTALWVVVTGAFAGPSATAAPVATPVSVFVETVQEKPVFNQMTFPARIESRVNAIVRSEADGAITKILKPLGSMVARGEAVAIIQHTDPVYEYAPLKVIASVQGVVNEVHITNGSLVNKGDPVVTITDPKQLRVMVEVAALDVRSLRVGMNGELLIPGLEKPLQATIAGVSPSVDPMLGTATAELKLSAAEQKRIVAGMVGRVQFKIDPHNGVVLPEFAIVYRGDSTFVRIVQDGKAQRVAVKVGERRQGQVEVLSGVKNGDVVIDRASGFVADGAEVKVETAHE